MNLEDLRTELRNILALEEQTSVDWPTVEARCLGAVSRLNTETEPAYPHDIVYHFLDDPAIRRKDSDYGDRQRRRLKAWLSENA